MVISLLQVNGYCVCYKRNNFYNFARGRFSLDNFVSARGGSKYLYDTSDLCGFR